MKNHFSNLEPLNPVRENINIPLLNLESDENVSPNVRPLCIPAGLKKFKTKEEFTKKL